LEQDQVVHSQARLWSQQGISPLLIHAMRWEKGAMKLWTKSINSPCRNITFNNIFSARSWSHVTTDGRSVCMSRYRAHLETCDQILLSARMSLPESCCLVSVGRPLWREVGSVICLSQSVAICQYLHHGLAFEVEVTLQLTVSQPVCQGVEPTLGLVTKYHFLSKCCLKVAVLSLWGALSDERSDLSFVFLSL
jgi:hypothetical protein